MAQSVDVRQHGSVLQVLDASGLQRAGHYQDEREDEWRAVIAIANDQPGTLYRLVYVRLLKPLVEWLAALLLTVCVLPLLLTIIVVLLVTSGRPIFFRQQRVGRGGHTFTVYKFRTMIADRRTATADVPWSGVERRLEHKTRQDPRVTRVGRVLRRCSLDELPQLFNVLRGDMALVGPRPELPRIVLAYEPWQHQRHLVRPGITGWWQVNGRSHQPMHAHTELDLYYVNNLSLRLDLLILLRTVRALLGRGAF